MSAPLPARIVIPVANPATAEELIRLGADLRESVVVHGAHVDPAVAAQLGAFIGNARVRTAAWQRS